MEFLMMKTVLLKGILVFTCSFHYTRKNLLDEELIIKCKLDAKEEGRQNRIMEGIGIVSKKSKEKFEVIEGETIDACLDRIKAAGYFPVRRTEEPIFAERIENGKVQYVPVDRKIVFEVKLIE